MAGASTSTLATISDALRYDAWGQVTASVTSALPTPWRYQGRLLVDPNGANDLYDAGARFYSPGLGVFTQLDTVQGSALDPLSLNRYLYAAADPETLVDPDGHASCKYGWEDCYAIAASAGHAIHHGTYRAPRPWLNRLPSWEIQMVGKGAKDRYTFAPVSLKAWNGWNDDQRNAYAAAFGQRIENWTLTNPNAAASNPATWYAILAYNVIVDPFRQMRIEDYIPAESIERAYATASEGGYGADSGAVFSFAASMLPMAVGLTDNYDLPGQREIPSRAGAPSSGFGTQPGEAVFWSGKTEGQSVKQSAAAYAAANQGATLEDVARMRGIALPEFDASNPTSVQAWANASREFASGASGSVRVILGEEVSPQSFWSAVELPALKENPRIIQVIAVNPKTGAESLLFSR